MFSTGQIYFAIFFVITFITTMIFVYRRDLKIHKLYFKGSYKIIFVFIAFIATLFIIKFFLKKLITQY
jgi:hypothetical protein